MCRCMRACRRAMPPRPSLLVGDAAACEAAAARLATQAESLLASLPASRTTSELQLLEQALCMDSNRQAGKGHPDGLMKQLLNGQSSSRLHAQLTQHRQTIQGLEQLVGPLRFLRESLVSNDMLNTSTACQAYELSCDVAAAVGREAAPELFKALQGLITEIYPCLQALSTINTQAIPAQSSDTASEQQQEAADVAPSTVGHVADSAPQTAPSDSVSARQGEITSAYLLFFAAAPSSPPHSELVNVLRSPAVRRQWHHRTTRWAVKVLAALSRGDWLTTLRLRDCIPASRTGRQPPDGSGGSRLLRELLDFKLAKVQRLALAACGSSYRTLPWHCARHLLGLQRPHNDPEQQRQQSIDKAGLILSSLLPAAADTAWDEELEADPQHTDAELHAVMLARLCGILRLGAEAGDRGAVVALNHMQQLAAKSYAQPGTRLCDLIFKV